MSVEQAPLDVAPGSPQPERNSTDSHTQALPSVSDEERLAAAKERQQWRESPEFNNWSRAQMATVIAALLLIAAAVVLGIYLQSRVNDPAFTWATIAVTSLLLLYLGLGGMLFSRRILRGIVSDRILIHNAAIELREQESKVASAGENIDFGSLWAVTQQRIDLYHDIATQQSRNSFRSAQIAAYLGFGFLIALAVFAGLTKSGTGAIAASVIGVAGAGMSAYIGSTFMKAQASSSDQLGAYFLQPVEFARALGAERLLDKVEPGDRGKIVERIVQSMTPLRDEPPKS